MGNFDKNPPPEREVTFDKEVREAAVILEGIVKGLVARVEYNLQQELPTSDQAAHLRGNLLKLRSAHVALRGLTHLNMTFEELEQAKAGPVAQPGEDAAEASSAAPALLVDSLSTDMLDVSAPAVI